jgi:DNA-binding SARP family transcriptional activator
MIRIRTLGPVDVSVDGAAAPAELLWRKHLALLVYLARSPARGRARDHLINLLWDDKTDDAARHSLNEAIRILRRYSSDGVDRQQQRVQLSDAAVALDVDEFEKAVASEDYDTAARLVLGEFMEGFSVPDAWEFEEWLAAERTHWRKQSTAALTRHAHESLARGDTHAAMHACDRALALDPACEEAARVKLTAYCVLGDRAGALRFFEEFRQRLSDAVGVDTSDDTNALVERIKRERVWAHAGGVLPATTRRAPLAGVSQDLSKLMAVWRTCSREKLCGLSLIEGDGGTGRTRLLEEVAVRARLDGANVLSVRAVETDRARAWSTTSALLNGAADIDAVRAELIDAARSQPVLVAIDDAQWVDEETLAALPTLLRDLARHPVMFVLTIVTSANVEQIEALRTRIGRDFRGAVVTTSALAPDALRMLVKWSLPDYGDDQIERVSRRVSADSAGKAFLVVELLHAIANGLDVGTTRTAWPQPFHTFEQTMPGELPDAVVAAIRVSYRKLSGDAQKVLAAVSVIDGPLQADLLGHVTGLERNRLNDALDELEWQRWLTADARGYSFVARIARDVVARDMVTDGQRERFRTASTTIPAT